MRIPEDAPTRTLTIQGDHFTIPQPYKAGHVLRPNEANQLNHTFAEHIRNNFTKYIQRAKPNGKALNAAEHSKLQADLDEYIREYDFGLRRGGAFKATDHVEAQAMSMAKDYVRELLRREGKKVSEFTAAQINTMALGALEKRPRIRHMAEQIVEARLGLERELLDDLSE